MIQSMTAFAHGQRQGLWGSMMLEIRSINHRYLEVGVRLPEMLHSLEKMLRERLRHHISRGKVDCYLRFHHGAQEFSALKLNTSFMQQLRDLTEETATLFSKPVFINMVDLLKWPGALQNEEIDLNLINDEFVILVEETLVKLLEARKREGEELKKLFFQRLNIMRQEVNKVRKQLPSIIEEQYQRLRNRFYEAKIELDSARLTQEIVLFSQKIDVSEELERIDTHINEIERVLNQGGAVGRRLDFLLQELNREANTLGAKSVNSETTAVSVELKVLIEQIREQAYNIE